VINIPELNRKKNNKSKFIDLCSYMREFKKRAYIYNKLLVEEVLMERYKYKEEDHGRDR
jgi:hypothetical protein